MFWQLPQDHPRRRLNFAGVAGLILCLLMTRPDADAQAPRRALPSRPAAASATELNRVRADVIEKIKETHAGAEKLLRLHEAERVRIGELYDQRREQYYLGLISRSEVLQAEHALAEAMLRVDEDKRWLAETEMALTEYGKIGRASCRERV